MNQTTTEPAKPSMCWKDLLLMGAVAVALRIALALAVMRVAHVSFATYAASSDGTHYLAVARAWLGDTAEFAANPLYQRLFPGYPALMALLHLIGLPLSLAALLPSWLAVAPVAILSALYFRDRRIGWAMAVLTPSYILNASLISTEAVCLLLGLIGLLSARRGYVGLAGIAFGLGGLVRPVIVFAFVGWLVTQLMDRRWRTAVIAVVAAGIVVVFGLAAVQFKFGDALMSFRHYRDDPLAYGGELLTLPFKSLIVTTLHHPPIWKIGFVWAHVLLVLVGCVLAIGQTRRATATPEERMLNVLAAVWLIANTLYVLCVGSHFGFDEFPRFIVPALPPLFWAYRAILPRSVVVWLVLGVLSLALAFAPAYRRLKSEQAASQPATAPSASLRVSGPTLPN